MSRTSLNDGHEIEAAVDRSLCIGNGICKILAPKAFRLDESMKAVVLDTSAESEDALISAAEQCPTQAIFLARHGKSLYPKV